MKITKFFRRLGPGLITGAADNDPSGIATYSQTGAQYGYGLLWTALFMLPLQTAVQEACARIGAVTGKGLSAAIKKRYNNAVLVIVILILLMANIINIGVDLSAMAEATNLLISVNQHLLVVLFTFVIILLEVLISYRIYANFLKWLCLSLLAYPFTLLIIDSPWIEILKATFIPHLEWDFNFLFIVTGLLGTTISPYMFFWQASGEMEEVRQKKWGKLESGRPSLARSYINKMRLDNFTGMLISQIAAWSIIVTTGTVLHQHGITDIKTAADAARAIEPLVQGFSDAGFIAELIFAAGIIGLGFIAIPVLAGSAAYAVAEAFDWKVGLDLKFKSARGFYGVIIVGMLAGMMINFFQFNPMKALVYTAVLSGVAAVPLIYIIAQISNNETMMGTRKSGYLSRCLVFTAFLCMLCAVLTMFVSFYH